MDSAQTAIQQKEQEYSTKSAQLAQAKQQLGAAAATISSGEAEYAQKAATLAAARSELDAAEQKLASARQTYQQNYEAYESAKQSASSQLEEAKAQLDSAKQQIDEAQQELDQKQSEYDQAKADADQQLQDAYDELTNKQSTLQSMGDAKWYIFNRTKNEGYVMYKNDVERMQSLATVFPIIYLVVAALVCLSTMTRMVEEERTLIGTFKALGFSNAVIASRYLTYAALASVVGGVLGTLVGFQAIPLIIWHAFSIAYVLPDLQPAVYVGIGAAAVAAMSAVTLVATLVTVMGSLRETPASLMRPKAPKRGKRVLLERITPLWNRLSFTQKVTFRNLFLNKRRLVTTLVGIAGCTALVVAACGTYARVNTILSDQFDGVWHYDATVGYSMSDDSTSNAANAADDAASNEGSVPDDVNQVLGNSALVSDSIRVSSSSWEAAATNNVDESSSSDKAKSITIVTPDDASKIESFITMYDPDTGEDVPFSDDSVVITEKLSMLLDAHAGDTIWVKSVTGDDWYELTVTGVTRNYTMNYVYLGKNAYAQALGEEPTFDRSYVKLADGASSDDLTSALSGASDLSFVSYTSDLSGNISTSISSVNVIVLVLVVTSGLLAFVVIYNLTTINVGERKRELATLKVLGFFDRECYSYILREIWITSAMGIAIGLFAGRYLYDAILTTVEPDMVLLLRTVPIHSYFVAAGLMLGFTWLVNQFVKPSIKGIDMLESLKSVE